MIDFDWGIRRSTLRKTLQSCRRHTHTQSQRNRCGLIFIAKGLTYLCFVFIRKEEQIKNDEQFARALQEKLQHESNPPEIISSDLLASRDNVDQGIDQGRGGQVSCFVQVLLNCCNSLLTLLHSSHCRVK